MKDTQIERLIVITREDLKPGYQIAQSGHAISQFLLDHPELGKQWNNNYLISLAVSSEQKLENLLRKLLHIEHRVAYFTEPDINNELTSICFLETDKTKHMTAHLPLSLSSINH